VKKKFHLLALDVMHPKYHKILRDCFHDEALQVEHAIADADVRYWCIVFYPGDTPPYVRTLAGYTAIEDLTAEVEWHLRECGQSMLISPRLNQEDRDYLNVAIDALQGEALAECAPMGSA
jgi:hypothetical protein